jgi:hypothetical protein
MRAPVDCGRVARRCVSRRCGGRIGREKIEWLIRYGGTFTLIFLSETAEPSDIHSELTLTCHGFVLFFAGKLCAAADVTQKVQPFAAMLPVLPFGVWRPSDRG